MRVIKITALVVFLIFNLMFNVFEEKQVVKSVSSRNIGVIEIPDDLVYKSNESYTQNVLFGNLFEGLVNKDSNGEIVGAISERHTVSEDGLTYRFYIRDDAYFSNGDKIKAGDFAEFFKNIIEYDEERNYYNELKLIKGVKEFYNGYISYDDVFIKEENEKNLVITLMQHDEKFISNLTKDKFSLRKNFKYLENYKDFYEYIVYTGPYLISDIEMPSTSNYKVKLKPNKHYYLNNYKTVKQKLYSYVNDEDIIFEVFKTRELALSAYKIGRLDFVLDIPYNSIYNYFESDELYYLHNESSLLTFNKNTFKQKTIEEVDENIEIQQSIDVSNVNIVNESELKEEVIKKGNFIDFIINPRDVGYMNGIRGDYLRKYEFDKKYILDTISNYDLEEVNKVKIITHSDDNYIELARNFRDFLKNTFNIESNVIALKDEYIENELNEKEYDILISDNKNYVDDEILFEFDKPNIILSRISLFKDEIDGNGIIQINNLY